MDGGAWLIRTPEPSDAEALGRMHHTSRREAYGHLLPEDYWSHSRPELLASQWRRLIVSERPGQRLALAEHAGSVVGLAGVGAPMPDQPKGFPSVRRTQVYVLYVLREHHGTGVGQALLDAVLPADEPAQLWVAQDNPRAQAFYRRNGFAADGATIIDAAFAGLAEIRMVR